MADTKISALSAAAALGGTEDIPGVQSAANVRLTPVQIKNYILVGGTLTADAPVLVTQTWNNSGVTFSALKVTATDTASNAASLLLDLGTAAARQFQVTKAGRFKLADYQQYWSSINTSTDFRDAADSAYINVRAAAFVAGASGLSMNASVMAAPLAAEFAVAAWRSANQIINLSPTSGIAWNSAVGFATPDTGLIRKGVSILGVTNASTGGGALEFPEMTAPAGAANVARIYAKDNGSGKTQLMVIFPSGAEQQLAIEA